MKAHHFTGMAFSRRELLGWMVFLPLDNVQLPQARPLHTASKPLFMAQPGTTLITLLNMLVRHMTSSLLSTVLTLSGGLFGPLVVHGPMQSGADYDIDVGPVMMNDWYHGEYYEILKSVMKPGGNPRPTSDNNLINGKMNFDCSTKAAGDNSKCTNGAGISKFKFTQGKTHRLRLINAGSEGIQRFSIDGHNMTIIAQDFVPIVRSLSTT